MAAPLFSLGAVVATPGALVLLAGSGTDPGELLARHVSGDWGGVPRVDAAENRRSAKHGWRVLSPMRSETLARGSGSSPNPTAQSRRYCHPTSINS